MKRNIAGLLVLAVCLVSCLSGKKYQTSDLRVPGQYRGTRQLTADTVQLPWRTFFNEPQLVSLIGKALEKNNDVAVAVKNIEQLELAFKQARLDLLPSLNLNIGANRSWLSKSSLNGSLSEQFVGTPYMDDYNASLQLSWEVDVWGKAGLRKDAARADYFAQKENTAALKTRLISQVAQAYYNLLSLDQQLTIAKRNIILSDSTLHIMRLQYRAGQTNSLAVNQAEAQKKTAELLVPLAVQNIAVQENALSILCGSYPDSITRSANLMEIRPDEQFLNGLPARLLSRRPDLKAAELAVIAADANSSLAKAAMYPSLSLSPQVAANSFKFNQWFDLPGSLTKTLAANLAQPIFQKRALRTAYESQLIEQEKAVIRFRQALMTAVGEVSDAMAKSAGASDRLALLSQRTIMLNKATQDAQKLYKSGMANYLEVITAQNSRLQNDLEMVSVKLEKLNALTELYRALGGGTR